MVDRHGAGLACRDISLGLVIQGHKLEPVDADPLNAGRVVGRPHIGHHVRRVGDAGRRIGKLDDRPDLVGDVRCPDGIRPARNRLPGLVLAVDAQFHCVALVARLLDLDPRPQPVPLALLRGRGEVFPDAPVH